MLKSNFKGAFLLLVGILGGACQTVPALAGPLHVNLRDVKNGGMFDSAAYAGKPIMIEFYFESCPACRANAPKVHEIAAAYHGEAAQVIEVSVDCDQREYDSWLRRTNPIGPVLADCDGEALGDSLGVHSFPTTIVLDADHEVAYRTSGTWNEARQRHIAELLGGGQ